MDDDSKIELVEQSLPSLRLHIERNISKHLLARISVDDIVQETFARACAAISQLDYRGEAQLNAWLKKIASNFVISTIRKHGKALQDEAICDLIVDSGILTPSSTLRRRELVAVVRDAVSKLDPGARELIRLRYDESLTFADIANAESINAGAVRGRHRNALTKIFKLIVETGLFSTVAKKSRTDET